MKECCITSIIVKYSSYLALLCLSLLPPLSMAKDQTVSASLQNAIKLFNNTNYERAYETFSDVIAYQAGFECEAYNYRARTLQILKEFRLALGDYDLAISLCDNREQLANLYRSRSMVEKKLGYQVLASRDSYRADYLEGKIDSIEFLNDLSRPQMYIFQQFGNPDTFILMFARENADGLLPPVRFESWRYNSLGTEFHFLDGEFIGLDELAGFQDGTLVASRYVDPAVATYGQTSLEAMQNAFEVASAEIGEFQLPNELLNGRGIAGEQMLAGFEERGELQYWETFSLSPVMQDDLAAAPILGMFITEAHALRIKLQPKRFFRFIGNAIRHGFERGLAPLKLQFAYQLVKTGKNHKQINRELRLIYQQAQLMHDDLIASSRSDFKNGKLSYREYQSELARANRFFRETDRLVKLGRTINKSRRRRALLETAAAIITLQATKTSRFKNVANNANEFLSDSKAPLKKLEGIAWGLPNLLSSELQSVISQVSEVATKMQYINIALQEIRIHNRVLDETRYGLANLGNWLLQVEGDLKAFESNINRFDKSLARKMGAEVEKALAQISQAQEILEVEISRKRTLEISNYESASQLSNNPLFKQQLNKVIKLKEPESLSEIENARITAQAIFIYREMQKAGIHHSSDHLEYVFSNLLLDVGQLDYWKEVNKNPGHIRKSIEVYLQQAEAEQDKSKEKAKAAEKGPAVMITSLEIKPISVKKNGKTVISLSAYVDKMSSSDSVTLYFMLDRNHIGSYTIAGPHEDVIIPLEFEYVIPQEISGGRHVIDIQLKHKSQILDEHTVDIKVDAAEKKQEAIPDEKEKKAWCKWYGKKAVKQFNDADCKREGGPWLSKPDKHIRFCLERGIEASKKEIARRARPGAEFGVYGDMQSCRDRRPGEH